jgi:hypothetical protein
MVGQWRTGEGGITWAQAHTSNEAETMRTFLFGLLSGTLPGLALGIWLESSPSFSEERENAPAEAFYQDRPTSFWLLRLQDHDQMYRLEAVQALEKIATQEPSIIPKLGEMLKDPNKLVRTGVAGALRRLGAAARPALPALLAGLDDEDQYVRCNVVAALGQVEPRDEAIVAALNRAAKDTSKAVRWMALRSLGKHVEEEKEGARAEGEGGAGGDGDARGETGKALSKR